MKDKNEDPVDRLGKDLAADHTLEKARAAGEPEPTGADEPEQPVEVEDDEPQFLGDFDSYDAVREYASDAEVAIVTGDLAVVNGGLVRATSNGKGFEILVPSLVDMFAPDGLHSDAHEAEMRKLESIVAAAEFESGSLLDDVRELLLLLYKGQRVLWAGRSQSEQRDFGKQVEGQAKGIIRKIARVVAEGEQIAVAGKLERYTHSGTFDLKLSAASDEETALQLFRMQGHDVVIMSADASRFLEAKSETETDEDEPELGFADPSPEPVEEDVAEDPPADDSDLAGGDETADAVTRAEAAGEDPGVGAYESRSNPDDEPETDAEVSARLAPADDFEEATEEELAQQAGRAGKPEGDDVPAADYVGPKEPDDAVPGETWVDTSKSDGRPRHKHPNGKWYLSAPSEESLEEWRASQNAPPAEDDDGFPADPE